MYRKYTLTKTYVINTHNYLLEAQEIQTKKQCMFHQILISSQSLPTLNNQQNVQRIISESQNQNGINELKDKYQFYLEQNLLQIRLKPNLKPISQLNQLQINEVLKLINTLNLDLLISIKQIRSILKHNQSNLNNINKFFSQFIAKSQDNDIVLPFIDEEKIHYYDVFYQEQFCKNKDNQKKIDDRVLRSRLSEKKLKKKGEVIVEDTLFSDEIVFQKYIHFLITVLNSHNIIDLLKETKKIAKQNPKNQDFNEKYEKAKNNSCEKTQKELIDLLSKCLANQSEYNLNIFIKECQLLLEKHQRMKKATNNEKTSEKSIASVKSSGGKEEKLKNSKSCLVLNRQSKPTPINEDKKIARQSQKKLKTAKSLISLKFTSNIPFPTAKNRSMKNSNGIFSKSKEKLQDKTNIFQHSWASFTKSKTTNFGASQSFNNMNTANSNWFNQNINENESIFKLRNFKKSNNFTTSSYNTPKHQQSSSSSSPFHPNQSVEESTPQPKQEEKVSESQLLRLNNKRSSKQQQIPKQQEKNEDKFTMTDHFLQIHDEESPVIESKTTYATNTMFKREIVNTINFKYYEELKSKVEKDKKQVKIAKEAKEEKMFKLTKQKQRSKDTRLSQEEEKYVEEEPKVLASSIKKATVFKETSLPIQQEVTKKSTPTLPSKNIRQTVKQPTYDQQQIEEVSFNKKKTVKNDETTQKKPILEKNVSVDTNRITQASQTNSSSLQNRPKSTKISINLLAEPQKNLYVKHFEYLLKFYKQHSTKINLPSKLNNLTFIVNFLYYKTLLQNKNSENNNLYRPLVNLLCKKQQKIKEEHKSECLLYRIQFESLWESAKSIKKIESDLTKGIDEESLKQRIMQSKEEFESFYILSCESNKLLQLIFEQLTNYVQTNKPVLIQSNVFLQALQLIYLVILTMIVSVQRENYYKCLLEGKFAKLQDCFKFKYEQSEEEYLLKYKKSLESRNIISLSVKEESKLLKDWYEQFK